MTKPLRILVCDDREDIAKEYAADVEAAVQAGDTVVPVSPKDLGEALAGLRHRARAFISGETPPSEKLLFDDCDVCLIDNSLLFLDPQAGDGAESIFGLVRAFTDCEFTISLNLEPFTDFDLRFLGGDPDTNADLALNERHLPLKSVWDRRSDGFNPSYWPDIRRVVERRQRRRDSITKHADGLQARIWTFFGFDQGQRAEGLQDTALGLLDPEAAAGAEVTTTFEDFFMRSARSLPARAEDRKPLLKHPGIVARVVEGELSCWLGRHIVAPQSTLVDLPHLVSRMPSLVRVPRDKPESWNAVVHADAPPFMLDPGLFAAHVEATWFNRPGSPNDLEAWGERPLFWWPDLRGDDALNRLDLEVTDIPDFVFLEDLSTFESQTAEPPPRAFAAAFRSSWDGRSVSAGVNGFRYAPRSALAR